MALWVRPRRFDLVNPSSGLVLVAVETSESQRLWGWPRRPQTAGFEGQNGTRDPEVQGGTTSQVRTVRFLLTLYRARTSTTLKNR